MKSYCKGLKITREMVADAYAEWRRNESGRKNHKRVDEEYGSPDAMIDEIFAEISSRTLGFRPIRRSKRRDRTNGKERVIGIASIKQQVCDYLCVMAMEEFLSKRSGFYQTANERGKGLRLCRNALRRWSRTERYFIKADVRKCYPSIKTDVVMRVLRKYVRSDDVLYVCETILDTYDGCLEIGSYFSLKMAQLVLSFLYHYVESVGKVRRGKRVPLVRHQIWHLDDVIITGNDKRDLKMAMRRLEWYATSEFGLEFKPWKVCRTGKSERLDLGGWTAYDGRVMLRGTLFLRATRAFARFSKTRTLTLAKRVVSYWGWLSNGDCSEVIRTRGFGMVFSLARSMISRAIRRERERFETHTSVYAA